MKNRPFDIQQMKQLRKKTKANNASSVQKIAKVREEKLDDHQLFLKAMQDVTPLPVVETVDSGVKRKAKPVRSSLMQTKDENHLFVDMMSDDTQWLDLRDHQEEMHYLHPNYEQKLLKRLRQGKFTIDARIDLHGLTLNTARSALSKFLSNAKERQFTHLLIIHGKGHHNKNGSVLKAKVAQWLELQPNVIAFTSAPIFLGGTGALVCRLKKTT